jgi:hypothetical protein
MCAVMPQRPHRAIWSFTEARESGRRCRRTGLFRTNFHSAPRIERLQSFYAEGHPQLHARHSEGLSFPLDPLASSPDWPISFCCSVVSTASTAARVSFR